MKITDRIEEATIIARKNHITASNIFAIAMADLAMENCTVYQTYILPDEEDLEGKINLLQIQETEKSNIRENGVHYTEVSTIWKMFGHEILDKMSCVNVQKKFEQIDLEFCQILDWNSNISAKKIFEEPESEFLTMAKRDTLTEFFRYFNCNFDEDAYPEDLFKSAYETATKILKIVLHYFINDINNAQNGTNLQRNIDKELEFLKRTLVACFVGEIMTKHEAMNVFYGKEQIDEVRKEIMLGNITLNETVDLDYLKLNYVNELSLEEIWECASDNFLDGLENKEKVDENISSYFNQCDLKETAKRYKKLPHNLLDIWDIVKYSVYFDDEEQNMEVVEIVNAIFIRKLYHTISKYNLISQIEDGIEKSVDGIMEVPCFVYWHPIFFKSKNSKSKGIKFSICNLPDGKWCAQAIPSELGSKTVRFSIPESFSFKITKEKGQKDDVWITSNNSILAELKEDLLLVLDTLLNGSLEVYKYQVDSSEKDE